MASKAPAFHTTIQPRWNKTLDANHEPGKTISGNRTATQDLPKNSLTLNVHALGYQVGKELGLSKERIRQIAVGALARMRSEAEEEAA